MKKNILISTIAGTALSIITLTALAATTSQTLPVTSQPVLSDQIVSNHACTQNCRLNIVLPADATQPPGADPLIVFADPSGDLTAVLDNRSRGNGATVLRFEDRDSTPFMNRGGAPMVTVPIQPGNNPLLVRPYSDGVCHAGNGCKYDVINTGQPDRPKLDPVIIIDPTD